MKIRSQEDFWAGLMFVAFGVGQLLFAVGCFLKSFQRRFTRGLTYLVGYTWSRAIDSGSAQVDGRNPPRIRNVVERIGVHVLAAADAVRAAPRYILIILNSADESNQ